MMNRTIEIRTVGQLLTRALTLVAVMSLFWASATAFATTEPKDTTVGAEQNVTSPVAPAQVQAPARYNEGPAQEKIPGGNLMLFAYFFIWLVPLFLLFKATQEASRLEQRLTEMERLVREATESKS